MYNIIGREEIGLPAEVRTSGGSLRPLITNLRFITCHYTGVNVRYGDVGDTPAEIRAINDYATRVGKPFEYNYVIAQDPDDNIYEYAGEFRAAHSAGENSIASGVLFLNGIKEPFTDLQWQKFQWLRDHLRSTIVGTGEVRRHADMPGAATLCCGDSWDAAKANAPFNGSPNPDPVPPPVTPPDSDNFGHYLIRPNSTLWGISAEVYGTGTRWPEIAEANYPDKMPNPGERWKVPGFSGSWYEVKPGDSPWRILDTLYGPNGWNKNTGIDEFWVWNGGDPATGQRGYLQPGEIVWVRA